MELRHLRYFTAVADELHFSRAAARLFITQSTLSVQIRQLEDEVGGPLLVRTSRAVELTESGRLLYAEARRAIAQAERALHVARQSVSGDVGSIRIGFAGVAVFSGLLPTDLCEFSETHPNVEVELVELTSAAIITELRLGAIDLGYLPDLDPVSNADLVRLHRARITMVVALREVHRLARQSVISAADLGEETLILPAGHAGEPTVLELIRPPGPGGRGPVRVVSSTLGVLALAAAGAGVAIVPEDLAHISLAGLAHRPLADVAGPALIVASRPDETLGPVRAFLRQLEGHRWQ